jgi:hypothetical protein
LTPEDNNITLPIPKSKFTCDEETGQLVYTGGDVKKTQNQIYSVNAIYNTNSQNQKKYSLGPFVKDVFGIIPIKTSGLSNGASYVEFGGTLQNQDRKYFGPVNIHRMTIRLVDDRGDLVDLNGANWSFSLVCEQLYNQTI